MNNKQQVREQIASLINGALQAEGFDGVDYTVETPREQANGDFSTNVAMLLAKSAKMPPRAVAEKLTQQFDLADTYVERVEIAGPGFINFYLDNRWLYDVLPVVESMGDRFGSVDLGKGKKVMVEFVSANPTGPMHMGNARGGALGDSMAAVLDFAGYDVTREFYMNDAGNQIEKFACSLNARYLQQCGVDVPFSEDWYQGDDITQRAKEFIAREGDRFVTAEEQERKDALTAFALEKNIAMMEKTLAGYRIHYDVWFRESDLHKDGSVQETIDLLTKSGKTYEKEGALWLKCGDEEDKDEVLVRANGLPTYFAVDIAYHRNKFLTRNYDWCINVWGADHHGHVARMKAAMEALGVDGDKLEVVLMQLVRLMRNGEVARMSKRTGKAITLDDLLEEIGIDAARFFFNMRNAGSHFDFDLDLAVQQSNDNPVFYVQYAHARICSIIRLLAEEGIKVRPADQVDFSLLTAPEELDLIRKISDLPDEITAAALTLEPSKMTRYSMELATAFHSFYNACRVHVEEEALLHARLKLVDCVRIALANVLRLLSVEAPEKM